MASVGSDILERILAETFGFPAFRAGQETVCRAVAAGRDALVVMPTGSGKSLCYQLPTLALGGTALVISPLIALMEDQVAKLNGMGLRADRIHSGRNREASRSAALAYRDGHLQFLFIAPERFSVPRFPEFLARRKPCLVAVDEAHCISQWGHDFRPDYRMLQRYLPTLRPAAILALTATATPVVQNDIAQQLALNGPLRSILGFRRENIAIEVTEIPPSARADAALAILRQPAGRPAIIYVPTRSESDSLAASLSAHFQAEPYHAGLSSGTRQKVQENFLGGSLDVIVATIAFGMGIDKPDVRTVIHTALPGSIEAYYQEIGRAGRDGAPSRAVLMHSYADRHRHDFFFDRDYPEADVLDGIFKLLRPGKPISKETLLKAAKLDPDLFDIVLDKLWVHRGALIDSEENVERGSDTWRESYVGQIEQRSVQLELMLRYAACSQCRMAALVRHFGDHSDKQQWCGMCDFCAPEQCVVQQFRDATFAENKVCLRVLAGLSGGVTRSTGRLHNELCGAGELERNEFEELLAGMGRSGLLALRDAEFEKDGKQILYRTAQLTREGEEVDPAEPVTLRLKASDTRTRGRKAARAKTARKVNPKPEVAGDPLMQALRTWRLGLAKAQAVPAFRIATDQVLRQIVEDQPRTEEDLLAISGIGPAFTKRYGAQILRVVKEVSEPRATY